MKKFLIIGNANAITYKEVFPLIKDNKIWLGISKRGMDFITSEGLKMPINAVWFTNIDNNKRHIKLNLNKSYNSNDYPKYDNYDAIEVSRTKDIPKDYYGVMGVPVSFLDKYCTEQFEIVDARDYALKEELKHKNTYLVKDADGSINGKPKYSRILIRFKK